MLPGGLPEGAIDRLIPLSSFVNRDRAATEFPAGDPPLDGCADAGYGVIMYRRRD